MQEKATIWAEFDPYTGNASFRVSGRPLDLCVLLGLLVNDVAEDWADIKSIPEELALLKVLREITTAARCEPNEATKIELLHKYKED